MKRTVLTISALLLLSAGGAFAADETPKAQQDGGCACACKQGQDAGHKHSGHMMHQMRGKQPGADDKAPQIEQPVEQKHVH